MVPAHIRGGTFSPSPAQQTVHTGSSHSPHGSHNSAFSAGPSPSTSSPTGSNSLTKIVVAQVYLLLSTIKEDKDRTKWDIQAEQLRKLIDEHGMEVFQKYFIRLVVGNAPTIFPALSRSVANPGNYQILVNELRKVSHDAGQASKIADSIETANEDIFRDFDLSTFMEHFKLDALEKTVLALAFKLGSRADLKTKADAILSANYSGFINTLSRPDLGEHNDLTPEFIATIVDRFIQEHPPNFNDSAKADLNFALRRRYSQPDGSPPPEVMAALYLVQLLENDKSFVAYIHRTGSAFTADEDTCRNYLRHAGGSLRIDEEAVSAALLYTAISRSPKFNSSVLVASLHGQVPQGFSWQQVLGHFDRPHLAVSNFQFLALYQSLRPLALLENEKPLDIQQLWGGHWQNTETQLSFLSAYALLKPNELDATTIPGLQQSFSLSDYAGAGTVIEERAAIAVRHPLVSVVALTAMFNIALHSSAASDTPEAKRLFQEVVVPNLDIFLVSAFSVAKPWSDLAIDTVTSLFDRALHKMDQNYDFVLFSLWQKDKAWVAQRLMDAHLKDPCNELPLILEHAVKYGWLDDLVVILTGFGLDLAALAHAKGFLDLDHWLRIHQHRQLELSDSLLKFLNIKATHELAFQRDGPEQPQSVMLPVKTISALLNILDGKNPTTEMTMVQRLCITAYPRLVNYGEGFDDIIDANGRISNSLPEEANKKMEEHYKRMYSDDLQVRNVVEALERYKNSRDPLDQDVFACMIHGLFDEYQLYSTYPLEALATTAVLFGAIIHRKLISDLPLEIGLGMILDAVRDFPPEQTMYKFGLQALLQLLPRLEEWPGFCNRLLQIPDLRGTQAWNKAEEVVRDHDEQMRSNGAASRPDMTNGSGAVNGNIDDMLSGDIPAPPFSSINVEQPVYSSIYEEPGEETQEKVLFVLNNITERNKDAKFIELRDVVEERHQQWFASHLVEERAKMQPNYHELYLDLVRLFGKKSLWAEILRETYVGVLRMLNAESTMQSSSERAHLKNLGGWLGSLTLARDKPIKHKNIAFKQLLLEAFDTQRLIVVIPFVCKVLIQGANSTIFKPPNPWLMDIIHLLIELYHHAELKLNLKFEIEVLCKGLNLDHNSIEPSTDIQTRSPPMEEGMEQVVPEVLDRFDNLSMNGMGGGVNSGRFSPSEIITSIPDLGPLLSYPPANDLVNQPRLQEIVKHAITKAVHEIIAPVVERSVTIAAISTAQMIHKDFVTEPDENRVRMAAINMVKRTAGSLALVTSKEPLRSSMGNYIRMIAQEMGGGLPEGTIIMCVNSNLEMACSQVEKKAEERAVPEIEEMIEGELEARRRHRMTRPNEPYMDPSISRWAWTIPEPYRLVPKARGLNQDQMAIYDEFARQPRIASVGASAHGPSASDATRAMANDVLQDQYSTVPTLPTPVETPSSMHPLNNQQQLYAPPAMNMANGRLPAPPPMDHRVSADRIQDLVNDLVHAAENSPEQHYVDLPRSHDVLNLVDALISFVIRSTSQLSEDAPKGTAECICRMLFDFTRDNLAVESLVHVLDNLCRIQSRTARYVVMLVGHQPDQNFLNVPLVIALMKSDLALLDWQRIDLAAAKELQQRNEAAVAFLSSLMDQVLLNEHPIALRSDFARSLEVLTLWLSEDSGPESVGQLGQKLRSSGISQSLPNPGDERLAIRQDQMEYIFEEWVHLCNNSNVTDHAVTAFIGQLHDKQIMNDANDSCMFFRLCIDAAVDRFEQCVQADGSIIDAYLFADAVGLLIARLVKYQGERDGEVKGDKAAYLSSMISLVVFVANHHHVMRGERFNQRVFFRIFSTILCEVATFKNDLPAQDQQQVALVFAETMRLLQPAWFPGFIFSWTSLISHRDFLPPLLRLADQGGWEPLVGLLELLLRYTGNLLKPLHIAPASQDIYRGVARLLVVLQQDFPDFLSANHIRLCAAIPINCPQLHNLILYSNSSAFSKIPDPLQAGLKIDRLEEMREAPVIAYNVAQPLRQAGLFDIIDQALKIGPSEDAVAHVAYAIQRKGGNATGAGFVSINVDTQLIDCIVVYIGMHAVAKASQNGGPMFVSASPDAALLTMLVHELKPEARYFFINSITSQLRFPNSHTNYFSQAILELFGSDMNDQEENEIREQITRILLERTLVFWPHPWGLIITIVELVKNEKYMFFELPFVKAVPDVAARFSAVVSHHT